MPKFDPDRAKNGGIACRSLTMSVLFSYLSSVCVFYSHAFVLCNEIWLQRKEPEQMKPVDLYFVDTHTAHYGIRFYLAVANHRD